MAQCVIRSWFCGMFSHSVIFSNINTKRRSFATFSVIVSVPLVTSASLQSLSLNLLLPACLLNSLSLLLADIDKKDLIFFDYSIPPLLLCLLISLFILYSPVPPGFSCIFLPFFSSSSGLICPNILCSLQAPFHLFLTLFLFLSFLCLHHHSLFPDSLAPWALWYCCHGDAHHFLAWMEDTLLMRRQSERAREREKRRRIKWKADVKNRTNVKRGEKWCDVKRILLAVYHSNNLLNFAPLSSGASGGVPKRAVSSQDVESAAENPWKHHYSSRPARELRRETLRLIRRQTNRSQRRPQLLFAQRRVMKCHFFKCERERFLGLDGPRYWRVCSRGRPTSQSEAEVSSLNTPDADIMSRTPETAD